MEEQQALCCLHHAALGGWWQVVTGCLNSPAATSQHSSSPSTQSTSLGAALTCLDAVTFGCQAVTQLPTPVTSDSQEPQ